jgi:FKBP-type peptidyl-prolyl cis-trans isomerase
MEAVRRLLTLLTLALSATLLAGCGDEPTKLRKRGAEKSGQVKTKSPEKPTESDAKVVTTASGLKYQDLKVGDGEEAKKGNNVEVNYTGWLKDGTKFDSSLDRDEPLEFKLGIDPLIKGWHEGVAGMKVGGKRKLMIPPELGYGASGRGDKIPPNAELIFEIDLLGIKK